MTNSMSHVVFAAGVLLLVNSAFQILVVRAARRQGTLGSTTLRGRTASPITAPIVELHLLPKRFLVVFFGLVSIAFSEAFATTAFGVVICAGLSSYLGLEVWAMTRAQLSPSQLFGLDTLLYLAPSICFAVVAASWFVT